MDQIKKKSSTSSWKIKVTLILYGTSFKTSLFQVINFILLLYKWTELLLFYCVQKSCYWCILYYIYTIYIPSITDVHTGFSCRIIGIKIAKRIHLRYVTNLYICVISVIIYWYEIKYRDKISKNESKFSYSLFNFNSRNIFFNKIDIESFLYDIKFKFKYPVTMILMLKIRKVIYYWTLFRWKSSKSTWKHVCKEIYNREHFDKLYNFNNFIKVISVYNYSLVYLNLRKSSVFI